MNIKIDHLAFKVTDIDKMYEMVKPLGYVVKRRTEHHGGAIECVNPNQPELVLEFTTLRKKKGSDELEEPGFDHAGFSIDEADLKALVAAGYPTAGKPNYVPESGRMIESFKDPDGKKWQFTLN